jgi:hypothetical protein
MGLEIVIMIVIMIVIIMGIRAKNAGYRGTPSPA